MRDHAFALTAIVVVVVVVVVVVSKRRVEYVVERVLHLVQNFVRFFLQRRGTALRLRVPISSSSSFAESYPHPKRPRITTRRPEREQREKGRRRKDEHRDEQR
jgi:hypothetical protein